MIHLRPSGNAPKSRGYVEAETLEVGRALLAKSMAEVASQIGATDWFYTVDRQAVQVLHSNAKPMCSANILCSFKPAGNLPAIPTVEPGKVIVYGPTIEFWR